MTGIEGALSIGGAAGEVAVERQRYAHMQVVAARMARDDAQLKSYVETIMLRRSTPGYVRTDDQHAVATSFGKIVHDHGPERMCDDDDECAIWPCADDDPDATVAMIRVELSVRKVDVEGEAGEPGA